MQKQTHQRDDALEQEFLAKLESFGITVRDFEEQRINLTGQFGRRPNVRDLIWRIFNIALQRQAEEAESTGSLVQLAQIYRLMADFREMEGGDGTELRSQAGELE